MVPPGVESQVRLFGFGLRLEFGKELPSGFTGGFNVGFEWSVGPVQRVGILQTVLC